MKRTMKHALGLALIYLLSVAQLCWAMGLEVNPRQIDVSGVPLGRRIAFTNLPPDVTNLPLGMREAVLNLPKEPLYLEIKNKSNAAYYYVISILHTAETTYPLREGFVDIPDTNWIIPQEKEVRVEANQTKEIELFINIPNKTAFVGKKYQAVIDVISKKNNPQELFLLACQLRITFQTEKTVGEGGPFRRWLEWIKKNIW